MQQDMIPQAKILQDVIPQDNLQQDTLPQAAMQLIMIQQEQYGKI